MNSTTPCITLVGYGTMARAILCACHEQFRFEIIGRDISKAAALAKEFGQTSFGSVGFDGHVFEAEGKNILLAVKPHALSSFRTKGYAQSVMSVLAGVSIASLEKTCPALHHVRAMPNIAAVYRQSCTALFATEKIALAEQLFDACGSIIWLSSENKFDAAMALSGCAPAYLAMAAEALSDAGVREGLSREESIAFVRGLFHGFASLLDKQHPELIKESVASPSGVTIEGVALLESCGFRGALIEAIHRSLAKVRK